MGDENGSADDVQERLVALRRQIHFDALPHSTRTAITSRVIDTVGALFAGFDEPFVRRLRAFAASSEAASTASILGTTARATVEMAAFVNGTTARVAELNDTFHVAGKPGIHASDVILPLFAVAEQCRATGRDFLAGVGLAYEVCLRMFDATRTPGFDYTNFVALGTAVGAGALLGLGDDETRQCISIVTVANNALRRSRVGAISGWKAAASGNAGRAGVFAAALAAHGIDGPPQPFEGPEGWAEVIARDGVTLARLEMGTEGFRLEQSIIKPRGACGTTIPAILAAERAFSALAPNERVERVLVETFADAKVKNGTGQHQWSPTTREAADHSIPYVVAATLRDGTITPRQFDAEHLADVELRRIMASVAVHDEPGFSAAYQKSPCVHRTRVTVWTPAGRVVGESGGEFGDLADPMSPTDIGTKFLSLSEEHLGAAGARRALDRLSSLDQVPDVAQIAQDLGGRADTG